MNNMKADRNSVTVVCSLCLGKHFKQTYTEMSKDTCCTWSTCITDCTCLTCNHTDDLRELR